MKKRFLLLFVGVSLAATIFAQNYPKPLILAKAKGQDCASCPPEWSCDIKVLDVRFTDCDLKKCVKKVEYFVCIPPTDQLQKKHIDWTPILDSLRNEFEKESIYTKTGGVRDTTIVIVNVNVEIPPIVFPKDQQEQEKKDNCLIFWKSQPYLGIVAGWTSDRAHFSSFPVFGGKLSWEFSRSNCKGTFLRYSLSYTTWPNQFSKETGCGACNLQKPISANGLQLSAEIGKNFENGLEIFIQANSPLVWFKDEIIHPSPDQGVFVGSSVKLGPAELGAKIGGSHKNLGAFAYATLRPFDPKPK